MQSRPAARWEQSTIGALGEVAKDECKSGDSGNANEKERELVDELA
jgi:hypothetical protein